MTIEEPAATQATADESVIPEAAATAGAVAPVAAPGDVPTQSAPTAPRPMPPPATPGTITATIRTTAASATSFGRVDDDGTVYLKLPGGGEHRVGQWAAGDPAQGLEFYANKYVDLVTEIDLAAKRLADDRANPAQAMAAAGRVRQALAEPQFVGDLSALVARVGQLEVLVNVKKAAMADAKVQDKIKATQAREKLVEEAVSLADSGAWKVATERYKVLIEEWKTIPRSDRSAENELWKQFSAARTTFDKRRRQHYAELESIRDEAKAAKQQLVKDAQALSSSRDWVKTSQSYRDLLDKWKKAGRAGKSDDALWAEFRKAQDEFFAKRNAVYDERGAEEKQNLAAKQALLDQAQKLLPVKDLRTAKQSMREISDKWDKAGRVPRGDVKRLDAGIRAVEDAIRNQEQSKWKQSNPELRGRAADTASSFRESFTKLEKQLARAKESGDAAAIAKAQASVAGAKALLDAAERGLAKLS